MDTLGQNNEMPEFNFGARAIERLAEETMQSGGINSHRVVSASEFPEMYQVAENTIMDLYHRIINGDATSSEAREAISALAGIISYFGLVGDFKTERRAIEVMRTFSDGALKGLYE